MYSNLNQLFYTDKLDKARALSLDQFNEEFWNIKDVEDYWYSLGYDIFFIRSLKLNNVLTYSI